ncbi:karyogamy protein [Sporormia fimetaria CBS 119925]|uniref:Karyogamy protein n=1 Tax=Sporormia fimetaria CBS 119925 TaxID=1340428 RepID=A0A6A6UY42_9PLEO|nr:karyogamy protein [Sporormia fimetaria CBS 119925]
MTAVDSNRSSFVSTSDRVLPSDSEEDTHKYRLPDCTETKILSGPDKSIVQTPDTETTRAPTPPPKDTPPVQSMPVSVLDDADNIDVADYFHRRQFLRNSRANSVYTLSRASFTNQIQQLTSIALPPAASLSSSISAIPTSIAAARALHDAANQIKMWMYKATEVLSSLDAEDDVQWAAEAGREGLAEVDAAIGKFEGLVNVYITAIEDLQCRPDIAALPPNDLTRLVTQMEEVLNEWKRIKQSLKAIKGQVELAMEWEELWNIVLGEIGQEVESLSRHVFEMEERRHRAITESVAESADKFDIADLENMVEDTPRPTPRNQNNRFSLSVAPPLASPISPIPQIEKENSNLLALFAKLQPLRASLDFLPMRLSSFHLRASKVFPSACDELMRRKDVLEKQEKKLEADADALREELGEDKWVHSFRQAGGKAVAMYNSLMKSIQRLQQAIDENDEEKLGSRISTYKDKKEHYPPSMKRVLELIDIEMKNRSTVNGEILRIQQDVRQKVADLERETADMDAVVEELTSSRKLRDSVSTVLSVRTEQSLAGSVLDTPSSSPASSVILTSRRSSEYGRSTPASSRSSLPANRRYSSLPTTSGVPRKPVSSTRRDGSSSISPSRATSATPTNLPRPGSSATTASGKPRWNTSTKLGDTVVGHNFKPLSLTTPSPYQKPSGPSHRSLRSVSSHSGIPVRSPLRHTSAVSPPSQARPASTTPAQQTIRRRPGLSSLQSPTTPVRSAPAPQTTPRSSSRLSNGTPPSIRRAMLDAEDGDTTAGEESPIASRQARPASSMNSRRSSLLPMPKQRTVSGSGLANLVGATPGRSSSRLGSIDEARIGRLSIDGRSSRVGGRKSALGQTPGDERPRWK